MDNESILQPPRRLSVATTIDDDAFPDFSDPNLFSASRSSESFNDDSSLISSAISPTLSLSTHASDSPIASGDHHSATNASKRFLPVPMHSGNNSQSSFTLSEDGIEDLPPEVLAADISISCAYHTMNNWSYANQNRIVLARR